MASKRLETAKRFIAQFATPSDTQGFASVLAENYTHQFAPASLNLPVVYDKQGFLEHIGHLSHIMTGFPVTGKQYIETASPNGVTVWATGQAKFRDDVKDDGIPEEEWEYTGEYVFMLSMDEAGEKVVRTVEFLDSKATDEKLRPLMKRARQNRERRLEPEGESAG
jgi:hypothetical protein